MSSTMHPVGRASRGFDRPARPAFAVGPEHLTPYESTCTRCGGPTPRLHIDIPDDERGGADQAPPDVTRLGGLTRYFRDHECSRCELSSAIAGLFPGRRDIPVVDPTAAALAKLTEPAVAEVQEDDWPSGVGLVFATPRALQTLARANIPGFDASVAGAYEWGKPFLRPILARFVKGDLGSVGRLADADPKRGASPLGTPLDQAAAAVKAGRGTVRAAYPLTREIPREYGSFVAPAGTIGVWCELAGPQTLTLVSTADELPTT